MAYLHRFQPARFDDPERGLERAVLGVADLEAEYLAAGGGADPAGDDHRLGHDAAVHPGLAAGGGRLLA